MGPLPPASLSEQGENDFQKWGRKTADITHLPSSLTSEKRGNSFFRKMGKYYLLFTGMAEGIAKGIAKGSLSKSLEIAGKMKELGVDISIIVQASGLSEEQILAL